MAQKNVFIFTLAGPLSFRSERADTCLGCIVVGGRYLESLKLGGRARATLRASSAPNVSLPNDSSASLSRSAFCGLAEI